MAEMNELYCSELKNFQKRVENELTILLYHGITNCRSNGIENFSKKHIENKKFIHQMKFIKRHCNLLSIDDVIEINKSKRKYPSKSVVVSFDDGFENNYTVAAPILLDLKVPAVFYITSGIVNTDIMFWVDMIEDCINLTRKRTIAIRLEREYEFCLNSNEKKIRAVNAIKGFCKRSSKKGKDRVVKELIRDTGIIPAVEHSRNYSKIKWYQIKEMFDEEMFTIGGHSLYHDILSDLPKAKMSEDICLSIKLLEYNLGKKIIHYSYPEGQEDHYNEQVIRCLKSNGIECAPSARVGLNDENTDLFNLNRIMVGFMGSNFPFLTETECDENE